MTSSNPHPHRLSYATVGSQARRSVRRTVAPEAGFEPATRRLTVACSTAELLRNELCRGRRYSACEAASFGRAFPARQVRNPLPSRGGLGRNRTGIDGFAVRYIATLPPGRREERPVLYSWRAGTVKRTRDAAAFDALVGRRL